MTETARVQGMGRRERLTQYVFMALGVALLIFGLSHRTRQSGYIAPVESRKVMPALEMERLDGGEWRLEDHLGQVVLINYWATWCGPCQMETPGLVSLARELGPKGLAVVGVSMDTGDRAKVRNFVERFQVSYPVVFPARMSQMEFGMEGLPTTILLDRNGRVAKTYVGAVRRADFEADVNAVLREPHAAAR
ncbi:MAG TPA: TlpA disulfide reductase family protein [Edaphobacter sp.]|nr:TlpA disulfide reductase family protein [Edaphobacter sp.]